MKTVKLSTPLTGGQGQVLEFRFREPKFEDYMVLGDPRVPIPSGEDDKVFMRPVPQDVRLYAERLLVDGDPNVMAGASLRDSFAIQAVILSFFREAESVGTATTTTSSATDATSPS